MVGIINTNKKGEIIGFVNAKDQFGNVLCKSIVHVTLESGSKKRMIKDKIVNYTIEVNPAHIVNIT